MIFYLTDFSVLFTNILAATTKETDALSLKAPDSWKQGRTLYGGLTSSVALHAARELTGESRKLRSALISFVGPSTDEVVAEAHILRSGRTAATVRASLSSEGTPATEALLTFSDMRESAVLYEPQQAPKVSAPDPAHAPNFAAMGGPAFMANFDIVPVGGGVPMSGALKPEVIWWARHTDPSARDTDLGLLCIGDVLPPAALTMTTTPVKVSSMTWMVDIVADDLSTEDGWYLFRSSAESVRGGFSTQDMSIWNSGGGLVAKGRQTVTMFG
ncbi:thioesterase family protein [Congregibacter brevis]|uniref:Thioesterase family protein n=1 Tax=Congregibacter brevis TaxID=3081201 RepID=A0ABZ0IDU2_9GAMM|nr:thioesterase family protein [Congregibacter sp. IMCC45268]